MKSLRTIIFSLLVVLAACEGDDELRYRFMERSIEQPDNLEVYIKRFPLHTNPFIKTYLEDEANRKEKMTYLITMIKRYFPAGKFQIICDRKYDNFNRDRQMNNSYHEVIFKGESDNRYLRYEWIFDINRYRLHEIEIVSDIYCK